jgi:hypothetical protein
MKRNLSIERKLAWKTRYWAPEYKTLANIIPPRSVIRVVKSNPDWDAGPQIGDTFRIGYYSRRDGPNCVWLVNDEGKYNQTWDQVTLPDHFEVVQLSDETDIFGNNRPPIGPVA